MDFEEFLWAMGDETTIPYLRECFENLKPLGQAIHRRVMNDFRQYILTGGMPQAVEAYIKTKNFEDVDRIKKRILSLYRQDVTKFAHGYEARVLSIFDEIGLDKFKSRFKGKIGQAYILYTKDIAIKENVIHLPLYMAMFL